jgi:hypothetical protein
MFPPTSEMPVPSATESWLPCTVIAPGFDPKNPNAATGAALKSASALA